jgi:acyl-lipid omega-6 desaturase (Delta-12 desaturase)
MTVDGPQRAFAPSQGSLVGRRDVTGAAPTTTSQRAVSGSPDQPTHDRTAPGVRPPGWVRPTPAQRATADTWSEERRLLRSYARPHLGRSLAQLATSVVPYVALWIVMYRMIDISLAAVLVLAIPAAGFQVRTFIVFHDCSHGSFLPSKRANAWLGALLGVMVLAPYRRWSHDHAIHHATSGDLGRRGVGDIPTLTLAEYAARSPRGRIAYRMFRHPLVMFGIGPIFAMMIGPRIATRSQRPRLRHSVLLTDVAITLVIAGLCWLIGWKDFLLIWGPSSLLAGSAGIWLFYVQHQFEDTYWTESTDWSYVDAALYGSSYLKLPKLLQFFSGNIGLHHVHHLNAKIPNYNLQRAHDENSMFHRVPVLTLRDGMRAVQLKLWDESRGTLISFAQARHRLATPYDTTS